MALAPNRCPPGPVACSSGTGLGRRRRPGGNDCGRLPCRTSAPSRQGTLLCRSAHRLQLVTGAVPRQATVTFGKADCTWRLPPLSRGGGIHAECLGPQTWRRTAPWLLHVLGQGIDHVEVPLGRGLLLRHFVSKGHVLPRVGNFRAPAWPRPKGARRSPQGRAHDLAAKATGMPKIRCVIENVRRMSP